MEYILSGTNLQYLDLIEYPEINIEENKMTFICGESGCGKSTLFKLMNASVSPSKGMLTYRGKNLNSIDTILLRRRVILIAQEPYLFKGTIKENFETYYSYREISSPDEETIKNILSVCCIDLPIDTECENLSGGEKQRVYLAIFLSFPAEVFLLDEPTAALDEETAHELIGNIKSYCIERGLTAVVVSHDKAIINAFADNTIELERRNDK